MDNEFKKQFDAMQNIEKAKRLAYNLGYDESYCDGIRINSSTYIKEMRDKISQLCGSTDWSKNVLDAYHEGIHDGNMDS